MYLKSHDNIRVINVGGDFNLTVNTEFSLTAKLLPNVPYTSYSFTYDCSIRMIPVRLY